MNPENAVEVAAPKNKRIKVTPQTILAAYKKLKSEGKESNWCALGLLTQVNPISVGLADFPGYSYSFNWGVMTGWDAQIGGTNWKEYVWPSKGFKHPIYGKLNDYAFNCGFKIGKAAFELIQAEKDKTAQEGQKLVIVHEKV